ncbi:Mg/Co/Ni transporter MgtE [Stackebrandtia albiflava]|uniref:Mg/Co/Ni transporter MgtE n=1 Tax=Stackebrandtia albiflava TaxID=406432 RepID=A0A562UPI4_9ACTN|nr:CBS domain-containing protein [Stackebrandtia albiflava]TWJ07520.1 Mg/Co/Ni transporter MgtE [Stackebrandtia albiflava]
MATTAGRVYIAQLAGTAIFDPNGDQVGRVSDAVVRPRSDSRPPPVLGLVAEIQAFRRIFIPMGRVTSVASEAVVLSTGTLNLRKFSTRPGEVLTIGELLDRRVGFAREDGHGDGEVVDVAMERDRQGDWWLTRVAVRRRTKRLSRRGQLLQLNWEDVTGLGSGNRAQGAAGLVEATEDLRAADLANLVRDLPLRRRVELAAALHDDRLAALLEELSETDQVELIHSLDRPRAATVIGEMGPDDAADLLNSMPAAEKLEILSLMEPAEADPVRQLLQYREGTAGSIMTSEPIILAPDATVAEALAFIRVPQQPLTMAAQVFVCRAPTATPTGRYLGTAFFQRLLREPPSNLLAACVDTDIDPLDPDAPLMEVTRRLAAYDLVAIPVVRDDRLIGAVTVDDVLDHLLPPGWRERNV